ncbi:MULTISPECIES: nuclear transport factor 2 family protein [unclassified Streptomyces]|uniref:nuclear transport factor 2 family protein n=1 Tax=unclassified Streptomyces TaxID=2593676 RepID=UPI00344E695A
MSTYTTHPQAAFAASVPAPAADPYVEAQRFYARQAELLDGLRAEAFAETFTEDGTLSPSPVRKKSVGRGEIARSLRAAHHARFGTEPVRRRHWYGMLQVDERPDGTLRARFASMVWVTRPWNPVSEPGTSALVEDVLVRDGDRLLVRERRITPDHLSF